jgi:NAD-dependent SIR2 family protein deacetylase
VGADPCRIKRKYPELQDPQEMFDYEIFLENPDIFYSFAKEIYPTEERNPTFVHFFIAELEKRGKLLRNYTQNIDTLEDRAGISKVFRCHGGFHTARCITCGNRVPGEEIKESLLKSEKPYCIICVSKRKSREDDDITFGLMKPDIVFFHEPLPDEFSKYLMKDIPLADLVIVMGSSLQVAPVSSFVNVFPEEVPMLLINMERIFHIGSFTASLLGDCQDICRYLSFKLGWDLVSESQKKKVPDPIFFHPNVEFIFKPITNGSKRIQHDFLERRAVKLLSRYAIENVIYYSYNF